MRHDPASAAVVIMLRSLKMYGMAQAVTDLIEQGAPVFDAAVPILSQLLKAEMAEREIRSIPYHMKAARFPAYKDIYGYDFAASEIKEATVRQLHRCEFMNGAQNIVLVGGPGTSKTHVETALGVQAIEHHCRKVRFFSTIELVNTLEQETAAGWQPAMTKPQTVSSASSMSPASGYGSAICQHDLIPSGMLVSRYRKWGE